MKSKTLKFLKSELEKVINRLQENSLKDEQEIVKSKKLSALNLNHYYHMRQLDLSFLQLKLKKLGLSRLARSESHVMHSLLLAYKIVCALLPEPEDLQPNKQITISKADKKLAKNTKLLLGRKPQHKRLRIMVTIPSEAANDYNLVDELVAEGMNCARINCAHDAPKDWIKMIGHIRKAAEKQKKSVLISMDLGGPKIRTAAFPAAETIHLLEPIKDDHGIMTQPLELFLVKNRTHIRNEHHALISDVLFNNLKIADTLELKDIPGNKRTLTVVTIEKEFITTCCTESVYLIKGLELKHTSDKTLKSKILEVKQIPSYQLLKKDDFLEIIDEHLSYEGHKKQIMCSFPELIQYVKKGERIYFDDGKIEGVVHKVEAHKINIKITNCKPEGSKLREDKGINVPDSDLNISGLTEKDREDFKTVAKYADVVNFSFVNTPKDLDDLFGLMDEHKAQHLGVILKIETKAAYNNLKELLLKTMTRDNAFGVMIARGDLAIEVGWPNIGQVQTEILRMCTAAHTPIIWATQVLETMAKKGIPSRSEMTDIQNALKAECIMLNKGPFMPEVLKILKTVLEQAEAFQHKNEAMLPSLDKL